MIFSDPDNGVVVIPHDKLESVVEMLPGLVEADDKVKDDVNNGVSVQEAFQRHRN